jgi:hypothetical protein
MRWGTDSPLPLGERSAAGRVRGPSSHTLPKGPLTRPKRVDLSPKGEVKKENAHD